MYDDDSEENTLKTRERETDRQTDRQTETERQTDRQRQRDRQTDRDRDRQTETEKERQRERGIPAYTGPNTPQELCEQRGGPGLSFPIPFFPRP